MRNANSGREILLAEGKLFREVSSEQRQTRAIGIDMSRQHGSEAYDIVVPECAANFRQVRLVQIRTIAGRFEIQSADLQIQRILLRSHQ